MRAPPFTRGIEPPEGLGFFPHTGQHLLRQHDEVILMIFPADLENGAIGIEAVHHDEQAAAGEPVFEPPC